MPGNIHKDINFVTEETAQQASTGQQFFRLMVTRGKTLIIFVELIVLLVFFSRFKLDTDINNLEEETQNKIAVVESSKSLETEYRRVQQKTMILEDILNEQIKWDKVIKNFDSKIPIGIILQNISYDGNTIKFQAITSETTAFAKLIDVINKNENVTSLLLRSSNYNELENNYDFSMEIILNDIRNGY